MTDSTQAAADLTEQEALTDSDIATLQEYLNKAEEISRREPPKLSEKFWNKFFEDIKDVNEIPSEYQDKVSFSNVVVYNDYIDGKLQYIPEGITKKCYHDIVWEKWNSERSELEDKYYDIVKKVFKYAARDPDLINKCKPLNEAYTKQGTILMHALLRLIEQEVSSRGIEQKIQTKPRKKTAAENSGAITSIGGRLFLPSDPEFQDAFITKIGNSSIGLFKREAEKGKKELALEIDIPFVMALARAILLDAFTKGISNPFDLADGKQGETGIYIPTIATELGHTLSEKKDGDQNIPSRAESRENFIDSLIIELDNIWGKLPKDTTEYKLISVHAYNPETEILYFVSPYLQKLISALIGKETEKLESGAHFHNWQCELLHSTVGNERNPAAVEMATRILVGLQQRGLKPDAKFKQNKDKTFSDKTAIIYKITCKRLIQDCPQIREKLKAQATASLKTQTLKRTFSAMYRILKKKTDLFTFYADVTLTEAIPTSKTLDTEIIITHHGRNTKYNKPFLHLIEE